MSCDFLLIDLKYHSSSGDHLNGILIYSIVSLFTYVSSILWILVLPASQEEFYMTTRFIFTSPPTRDKLDKSGLSADYDILMGGTRLPTATRA